MKVEQKKRSIRETIIFPIVAFVIAFVAAELIASYALLLRLRINDSQPFTHTEPSYLSVINVPFKAAVRLGLFAGIEGEPDYRIEIDRGPANVPDPVLGFRSRPGSYTYTYSRSGGGGEPKSLQTRETRLADGTRWTGTPGDGPTVHIFGDSFVAGRGVNDEQTFGYLLQQARPDLRVKLYAVAGYGMTQVSLLFNRIRDTIKPTDIVILGYADFYDKRNVVAPSRLRSTRTWWETKYKRPPDRVTLPKAALDNGTVTITYVQQRCDENDGYCDQADPPQDDMTAVTAALVNAIAESTEAMVYLLHFDGEKGNPVLDLIDDSVNQISALPEDFDYSIRDDIEGLDPHPGPYWHYAISRKLLETLPR